ncbi:unnamed protein product [Caenorhabditis brenneri]
MTEFRPYVNVRIDGQTIQQLENNGIILQKVLSDLGLTDVTISEGQTEWIRTSSQPILSTTIVSKINLPRYSTPIHFELPDLQRKFTLNLPQAISEIDMNGEDSFRVEYSNENESVDMEVQQILEEVVEEAVRRVEAPRFEYRQYSEPAFHSTVRSHPVDENLELSWSENDEAEYHPMAPDPIDETMRLEVDEEDATEIRVEVEKEDQEASRRRSVEEDEEQELEDQKASRRILQAENEDERKEEEEEEEYQEASPTCKNQNIYNFKCKFPKCGQKLIWRYKYGCSRLFDHALLHCNKKYIKCGECRNTFQTARTLRYHYQTSHKRQKAPKINFVILSSEEKKMKTTVSKCFADQIDLFQRSPNVLIPPTRK